MDPPSPTPTAPPADVADMTPEEATAQITQTKIDRAHPYCLGDDPGHGLAVGRMGELLDRTAPAAPPTPDPVPLPEAVQTDPVAQAIATAFQPVGVAWGLSAEQTQACAAWVATYAGPPVDMQETLREFKDTRQEATAAFDRAWNDLPATVRSLLERRGLKGHPKVVNVLVGEALRDRQGVTRLDAKEKMEAMILDRSHDLHHPEREVAHTKALAEYHKLGALVYGPNYQPAARGRR